MKLDIWKYVKEVFTFYDKHYLIYAAIGLLVLFIAFFFWIVYKMIMAYA